MSTEVDKNIEKHIENSVGLSMQEIEKMSFRDVEKHICKRNGIKEIGIDDTVLIDGVRLGLSTVADAVEILKRK